MIRVRSFLIPACAVAAFGVIGTASAADLTSAGYYQDFSSLGTGTSLATNTPEWTYWSEAGEHSWGSGGVVPASGVAAMSQVNQSTTKMSVLTALPAANSNADSVNGYNAALSLVDPGAPAASRIIATGPTGDAGVAWQLTLTNNTGSALTDINISYDIAELHNSTQSGQPAAPDESPGYQLFYSTDGSTWANVAALNPQPTNPNGPVVPNGVGLTPVGLYDLTFANAVANGSSFELRWVDPNGTANSDEMVGLTDVSVAPVPLPAGLPLLVSALGGLGLFCRRRKAA